MRLSLDELLMLFAQAKREAKITPWGYMHELDLGETANMLVKVIRVNDGHRTSLQYHREKDEVLIILEGEGWIEFSTQRGGRFGDFTPRVHPGAGPVRIKPGHTHRAVGPLLMLEISTRHPDDVVRVEDDYGR